MFGARPTGAARFDFRASAMTWSERQSTWRRWAKAAEVCATRAAHHPADRLRSGMPLLAASVLTFSINESGSISPPSASPWLAPSPSSSPGRTSSIACRCPQPVRPAAQLDAVAQSGCSWCWRWPRRSGHDAVSNCRGGTVHRLLLLDAASPSTPTASKILNPPEQAPARRARRLGCRRALDRRHGAAAADPRCPGRSCPPIVAFLIIISMVTTFHAHEPAAPPRVPPASSRPGSGADASALHSSSPIAAASSSYLAPVQYRDALGRRCPRRSSTGGRGFFPDRDLGVHKLGMSDGSSADLTSRIVVARYGLFRLCWSAHPRRSPTYCSWQAYAGHDLLVLTIAISADNFTSALGSIAFMACCSSLCTTGVAGTRYCAC